MTIAAADLAYVHEGRVYLNVTSRCPTSCVFCAKGPWRWTYRGAYLALDLEPDAESVVEAAEPLLRKTNAAEAVFCGFGEPTERLDVLKEVAAALRAGRPGLRLRLNTVGLAGLTRGESVVPELARAIDAVSVSLNTADADQWRKLHRPRPALEQAGFQAVCRFIRRCAQVGLETTATAIMRPDVDLVAVEALARSLGARFRLRPALL